MTVPSSRELPPILDRSSGVREPVELLADEFLGAVGAGSGRRWRNTRAGTRS